jgi:type I restriction enzyme S subunit
MSLPRYPEYKDSGYNWIGLVPQHWSVVPIKVAAHIEMGQSPNSDSYNQEGDGPPFLQGNADFGDANPIPRYYSKAATKLAATNDLLFSVRAPVGAINLADQQYGIGRGLCAIRGMTVSSSFLRYALEVVKAELLAVATGSTYVAVSVEQVASAKLIVPEVPEQEAIVAFLDRETAKVDTLITEQEMLLALLAEKRHATISHAVTRGLDPETPMQSSGVPWLGEVPAHWEVRPLGFLSDRVSYGFTNPMPTSDEGPYLLTANDIGMGFINYESARHTSWDAFHTLLTDKSRPQVGDVLITKDGTLGRVAVFDGSDACINQSVAFLRLDPMAAIADFVALALAGSVYQERMVFDAGGTTIKHIYISRLVKMAVATPPVKEQRVIVRELRSMLSQLDGLQQTAGHAIELLKERRSAVIAAAVTGKIDVRGQVEKVAA